MPKQKKKNALTQADQSERFREKVRELEAAGELNRIEADARFERMMGNIALKEAEMYVPPKAPNKPKKAAKKKKPSLATAVNPARKKPKKKQPAS